MKKILAFILASAMLLALAACGPSGAQGSQNPSENPGQSGGSTDVVGTYSVVYGTQEISGNVRHSGYISSLNGQEKNTLELKADGTYVYTKLLTSDESLISGSGAAPTAASVPEGGAPHVALLSAAAPAAGADVLFTWEPNNEGDDKGTCTLTFFKDGTYEFTFPEYSVKENGTWTWESWTMTVIKPSGATLAVEMNEDNALYFDYVSDINEALHQNFIAGTSAWGVALGPSGSYTPEGGGSGGAQGGLSVAHYFTGKGTRQTAEGLDYEVTLHLFLLSDGTAYIAEANDNNTAVTLGTWSEDGGAVTVTDGTDQAAVEGDGLTWKEIAASKSDAIPADYADADWAALVETAKAPPADGPIVLTYTFTGTYTVDGDTVTLNPAEACTWSEDWGALQNYGFTNVSGNENDRVYPKGPTGESYLPLDHFSGSYLFAFTDPETVTNNFAVKVSVDPASGSFTYIVESAFD